MIRLPVLLAVAGIVLAAGATAAFAQPVPVPLPLPVQPVGTSECTSQKAWTIDRVGRDYMKLVGQAEIDCGDMKFYADESIEIFTDVKRVIAVGNVVFTQDNNRIAADRADFNYGTRTGIFYNASGITSLRDDRRDPEAAAPAANESEVYFYGETVEKTGPETYRITKGAFTTCVQPTPRWELTSGTVTLNLDHHAILKNSMFRVKGVPLLYLPVFYYPVSKEDRASGFLIPVYGSSTIKGQSVSNAFFWAMNRSHDATFLHDWFSRTGQGFGAEYRYVVGRTSYGNFHTYRLREHEAEHTDDEGNLVTTPARQSYEVRGDANQSVGGGFRLRARADYFSDLTVQQTYHTNIYEASRRQRLYSAALTGRWGPANLNAGFERKETFFGTTSSSLTGASPKLSGGLSERPLFGSPLYFSVNGEFARMLRENRSSTRFTDQGLDRVHFLPVIRYPFKSLQWLTVNSSLGWHNTYWTESREENVQVEVPIWRRFLDMETEVVGPVLNRIWNTPDNGYMEKFKHAVEPFVNVQRTTSIDNFDEIVRLDSLDSIVGDVTRVTYGVNNRFYAKRRIGDGPGRADEILSVTVRQTYYTDARAAQFDRNYRTSFTGTPPSKYSPISLIVRGQPTDTIQGTMRAEYDTQFSALRSISADGTVRHGGWIDFSGGWSQRRLVPGLRGFDDPSRLDHYINTQTNVRTPSNRVGTVYAFNYDVLRKSYLQQRVVGYYNAQCCGFAVEYQYFDFSGLGSRAAVPEDRRLNFSFTLAGIGSFANIFGSMSGAPRR